MNKIFNRIMNTELDAFVATALRSYNADKKAHGKRALRCDAVTGIEMIEKPPMEYMEKLSREETASPHTGTDGIICFEKR